MAAVQAVAVSASLAVVANEVIGDEGAEGRLATEVDGESEPQEEAEEMEPLEAHRAGCTSIASRSDSMLVPRYSCLFDFGDSGRKAGDFWKCLSYDWYEGCGRC